MQLTGRDIYLLQYLARFDKPIELEEESVPLEIRSNFEFIGLTDRFKYPESIWIRLFELSKFKIVKEPFANMWEITELGRTELSNFIKRQNRIMVSEQALFKYFYKQDRNLSIEDLFERFGTDPSILPTVIHLEDNDWLEVLDNPRGWKITEEGKAEYERRLRALNPMPSHSIVINGYGNVVNTGNLEGELNNNLSILKDLGDQSISKSIQDLVETVKKANEINEEDRHGYLETLKVLSEQALIPKEKRMSTSSIKQMIQYGLGTLNTISSISTITGATIRDIANYFLAPK